jgi:aryl-alcohol dehydrogenase-like predicted oxidoreductase
VPEQSLYNLNARTVELEVIPACRHYGLGVIPWSPLGGGILGGALQKATEGRRAAPHLQHRSQLESYEASFRELDEDPANVALARLLRNPVVTAPIIGPRTVEQSTGESAHFGSNPLGQDAATTRPHMARPRWASARSPCVVAHSSQRREHNN